MQETIRQIGERAALARIIPLLPSGDSTLLGPGDDAAIVAAPDGRFLVTTDTMIEGPDFRSAWHSWHDLGWKAAATNLSDIAAMGARPHSLVVALAVPGATPVVELEHFARGLHDACAALAPGCGVVGGDLGTSDAITIAITAFGDLSGHEPVLRSGARAGDQIVVAGTIGRAASGLSRLFAEASEDGIAVPASERLLADPLVRTQFAPVPPVYLGVHLRELGATSMLDVSDGLVLDAHRIAVASGVRMNVFASAIDAHRATGVSTEAALFGGEDHALLCTLPAGVAVPEGAFVIGAVETLSGEEPAVTLDGAAIAIRGWDPFEGVPAEEV
ncbi:thiamine-phosphate kinase [Humidisolicoccus flavus]|uniref:thiamine-phosphate kinase n=1 Tax=Humidisolicoccus flavus TaxID=3111414 RepID=UPI0032540CA4